MDLEDQSQTRIVGCGVVSAANLDSCSIGLSDDNFVYNGTTYDISNLYIQRNPSGVSLFFGLNVAIPSALKSNATLSYGSTSLPLSSFTVAPRVRTHKIGRDPLWRVGSSPETFRRRKNGRLVLAQ